MSDSHNERIIQILQATPDQQAAIDRILDGQLPSPPPTAAGPLLLGMSASAELLGVSRATLWRMIRAGRLQKVEILPGSYRVRRADLEALVNGESGVAQ